MRNLPLIWFVLIIFLIFSFTGCVREEIVEGTGKIKYVDIEGGFYGIISDSGEKYEPINLPDEFKEDGLFVKFKLIILKNQSSIHMWGKPVYIIEIERLYTEGKLSNYEGCKKFLRGNITNNQDCIEYFYDGEGTLLLRHINAGFNCCPNITANVTIIDNKIIIEEIELQGNCKCLCLFDLNYTINYLRPGLYTIYVIEPYKPAEDETLSFSIELYESNHGIHCVNRSTYPWA